MNELVKIENNKIVIDEDLAKGLVEFEKSRIKYELTKKTLQQAIKDLMKQTGITSIKTDYLKATYKKETTRTSLDSKRIKEELPDVYQAYSKTTNVASSIVLEIMTDYD